MEQRRKNLFVTFMEVFKLHSNQQENVQNYEASKYSSAFNQISALPLAHFLITPRYLSKGNFSSDYFFPNTSFELSHYLLGEKCVYSFGTKTYTSQLLVQQGRFSDYCHSEPKQRIPFVKCFGKTHLFNVLHSQIKI